MATLYLIGTSHIAEESVKTVKKTIADVKPDVVALELDKRRFIAVQSEEKPKFSWYGVRRVGLKGFLFGLFGSWASNKLGDIVGVKPGSEMLSAIKAAKKEKATIALIDRDIEITLARFSKYVTGKEKWNFFVDVIKGVFSSKKELKKLGLNEFDLSKVPADDLIKKLLKKVKERYPNAFKVLVTERNTFLAHNLKLISDNQPEGTIVAVIGAGHVDEVKRILSKKAENLEIILS